MSSVSQNHSETEDLSGWVGCSETQFDNISDFTLRAFAGLLDYDGPPWPENQLPHLIHWLHFLPVAPQSSLDTDGHPRRGGFLPPVSLPRRMWASAELTFDGHIPSNTELKRQSTIANIEQKAGSSGQLVFVKVQHEIGSGPDIYVRETQNIVYREDAKERGDKPAPASIEPPPRGDIEKVIMADPVLLFRFSALTYNSHRIHYDRDYAINKEGHKGLVVHGPFLAMLLMDLFYRNAPDKTIRHFSFRALQPLYDGKSFTLCLKWTDSGAALWVLNADMDITLKGEIETS